jgi:exodeoxyribonuclease V alpha subunit
MTVHLSARIAWHMDGWSGRVCMEPSTNTYCVGMHSYPGTAIKDTRDLPWETKNAGRHCSELDGIPPCVYSINAFGDKPIPGYSDPPSWYPAEERLTWDLPASTVCIWPFEEMYKAEVGATGGNRQYDSDKRRAFAEEYLERIEPDSSLVFYYSNYSNPYSVDDGQRYVVVGASRVKNVSQVRNYEGMTPEARRQYGGGFVWAADLTSRYPDEGLRLPYHAYLDRPEEAARFLVVPPNPTNFKYATRQFSDDEALELVERLVESVHQLQEMDDASEDWAGRLDWLHSQIGALWQARGLYPGMAPVLGHLLAPAIIPWFKGEAEQGREQEAKHAVFAFLDGAGDLPGVGFTEAGVKAVRRRWKLIEEPQRRMLSEVVVRLDLAQSQLAKILGSEREAYGITATAADVCDNPYVLAEQFVGDSVDDLISFSKVDRGVLPSPELGGSALTERDDWRRLRSLLVERLRRQQADVFVAGEQLIHEVNERLSVHPEWKRHQFTQQYLEADRDDLEGALVMRYEQDCLWVYLRQAYEDERLLEDQLRKLEERAEISIKVPMTEERWRGSLRDPKSALAARAAAQYDEAIASQAEVCAAIFRTPLCVLAGEAGTGKTTVVKSLLDAVERTEGAGVTFQLLAPTGKAAERLRQRTGRPEQTSTVHSFLASNGWLNDNFTFRRHGGRREDRFATYVIDECSMLSLDLLATLFRAINWNSVRRLILVGDPSQLPPIGRGRVFADVIDWLRPQAAVGELRVNVRQMENRALDRGTAILELADAYRRRVPATTEEDADAGPAEDILARVQDGGDVDKDLRVVFWNGHGDLTVKLVEQLVADVKTDKGPAQDGTPAWQFWKTAFDDNKNPERMQVLSPYRGEVHGTEALNLVLQRVVQERDAAELRQIDGIALGDKVIQVRNRPRSKAIWAYNWKTKTNERVEVYNGEMGFAAPHPFDLKKLGWTGFRPKRFRVGFSTKPDLGVDYGKELGKTPDGNWRPPEKVEENLELAYAVSIHKAQGSEFERVYFIVPKDRRALLSRELFYTGLTRASRHCTLLIEGNISPLLSMRRLEQSRLLAVNASLFSFNPVPEALRRLGAWYEEGKIHATLASFMVRSKSEVIIANMLFERDMPFNYESPLFAPDGTFVLPDFTVKAQGQEWYWEHVGMLHDESYRNRWETKKQWYDEHFPGRLVTTFESHELSTEASKVIESLG